MEEEIKSRTEQLKSVVPNLAQSNSKSFGKTQYRPLKSRIQN
jgi:hypothetical protein